MTFASLVVVVEVHWANIQTAELDAKEGSLDLRKALVGPDSAGAG